ncbi:hypothetical protein DFJ73DRAFT_52510 [Zopfochytrium polystomum]|nr:hypothetical protein DFJ73DRAFT_52510 [Zopfochytrium polystomum]
MSTVPFLDPDVMLAVNRVAILSFLFSVFVFCFPILIALRVDGKISGKWVLIFFPAFGAILVLLILTVWTAVYGKDNSDPVDLDDDDDPKLEPRKASSVVARIAIVILKILYVVLIAVLFVLFALQLDGVINAWPAVFAPWFIMEVYHVVYATTVLLDSFESGKVVPWAAAVAEAPQSMDGDDSYLYVTRPFTTFEKMSEIFCAYQGIIFRMAQVALVVLKLSNPTYMSWTEAFVPTYILGVTVFIALALSWWNMSTTALAPPSQSNSAYASDARAVAIANLVLVAVCFTLVATSLGLLVTRLSRESSLPLEAAPVPTATATDTATGAAAVSTPPGTPPAGVILIPVFLLTSLVFCCLGVCLPFGLCVGRLGLKAELARSATPTASTASSPEGNEGGLSASSLRGLEKGKGRATAAASAASAAGEDFGESGPLIGRDKGGW